jgi:nucleoside 2-deoxyribosyltransferase
MSHLRKRNSKIATLEAARTIFFIVVGLAIRQSLGLFAHDWSLTSTNAPVWWTWDIRLLVGVGYITTALRYSHGISQLYGYERDQIETSGLPSSSRILGLSLFLSLLGILFYLMADNITRFSWFVVWTGLMLGVDFIYIAMSQVVRNPWVRLIRWLPARIFSAIRKKENSWVDTVPGYAADAALEWMTSDVVMLGICLMFLLVWNDVPHERLFASVLILATVVDYVVNREFYFGGRSDKRKQTIVFVCSPTIGKVGADTSRQAQEEKCRENIKQAQLYCESLMKDRTIIPFAPHAFYPYFLNLLEEDPTDKILSRYCGLAFLRACDAIYVYVPYTKQPVMNFLSFIKVSRPDISQLSSGMEQELIEAKKLGLSVKYQRTDRLSFGDALSNWATPVFPVNDEQPSLEDLEVIKRVYVCTPFRGTNFSDQPDATKKATLEQNIRAALWYCRTLVRDKEQSVAPFAPQAFYPYFVPMFGRKPAWDNWFSRSLEILKVCDAVYVYTDDGLPNKEFISVGMSHVIRLAEALGVEIQYKRSVPIPAEWKPALPMFEVKEAISDLPEKAVPAGELKTVPTMGMREQTVASESTRLQSQDAAAAFEKPALTNGEEKLDKSAITNQLEASPESLNASIESQPVLNENAKRPCLYFAAPLFTQAEWQWNERLVQELIRQEMKVILPQVTAYPMLKGEEVFDPKKLFEANILGLEQADIILAVFDQADPDSGTSWECGYTFKIGRPVIGLRTDIRGGGDAPGTSVNLMLSQSCKEFINLSLSQRDNVEWISSQVVAAVQRILKSQSA